MDGLIIVDKPPGCRSTRAVDAVKRLLPRKARIGHGGTLDPFATGVLILLVGKATRQCEIVMSWPKIYQATVKLGATTLTDDPSSPEQPVSSRHISELELREAIGSFVGSIQQRPSLFSALKINGLRACDLVRDGQIPALEPRTVQIHRIDLLSYEWPELKIEVKCGRGTYIRALARDIGQHLGVGGYLTRLRRTKIGPFSEEEAGALSSLDANTIREHLRPFPAAF